MLWILAAPVAAFLLFGLTLLFYVAIMRLKSSWDELHPVGKVLLAPWAIFGFVVLDIIIVNWLIGTVLFLELPRQLTFTSRLGRHESRGGWRGKVAHWICGELLDPYDPSGEHC